MHIMEGYLPASHAVAWTVASAPFVAYGGYRLARVVRRHPDTKLVLAACGAFAFVLSALKLPSVTGSCSHATGTGLGAILFGPGVMVVLGCVVLVFQALLLAHGGLTTLGANVFSMAIIGPHVAYGCFRLTRATGGSLAVAVFLSAAIGDLVTYLTTSAQLALAFPDPVGGFAASFVKFGSVFAITQLPLAVVEGLVTVVVINTLAIHSRSELRRLSVLAKETRWIGRRNGLLLLAVVLLAGFPLLLPFEQTKIFQSADGQAKAVIEQTRPDYQPWFTPIWAPPSAEIEGLLFALQAALGAGVLGYCIGHRRGKAKGREATRHDASD